LAGALESQNAASSPDQAPTAVSQDEETAQGGASTAGMGTETTEMSDDSTSMDEAPGDTGDNGNAIDPDAGVSDEAPMDASGD